VEEDVAETAAIEVDDAPLLATREGDASIEGVATLGVDEAETPQKRERTALSRKMAAQVSAGGVADAQLLDESGIVHSALLEIRLAVSASCELARVSNIIAAAPSIIERCPARSRYGNGR